MHLYFTHYKTLITFETIEPNQITKKYYIFYNKEI